MLPAGAIAPGQLADLAVLSADYFSVPEEEIKGIESVLTLVDGKVVYGAGEFAALGPPSIAVLPEWSPVSMYGSCTSVGQAAGTPVRAHICDQGSVRHPLRSRLGQRPEMTGQKPLWGLGCECFAF